MTECIEEKDYCHIGKFAITEMDTGNIWIRNYDGEGMETDINQSSEYLRARTHLTGE